MAESETPMGDEFLRQYPNKKEKKESYLSPSRVLSKNEYEKYRELRQSSEKYRYLNRLEKLKRENSVNIRREKYAASRSGRFSRRLVKGLKYIKSPSRQLYSRYSAPVSPQRKMQLAAMRQSAMQKQAERDNWSYIFSDFRNPSFNMASVVESEIGNHARAGFSSGGDMAAFGMEREVMGSANLGRSSFNPFKQINNEVFMHSNFAHILPSLHTSKQINHHAKKIITDPMLSVSMDAIKFSNLVP